MGPSSSPARSRLSSPNGFIVATFGHFCYRLEILRGGRSPSALNSNALSMLPEGTAAPSFALPDQLSGTVSLSDFRGRWVVLWWFVEAATPG
jgi:AhpC/TSA family